MENLVSQCSGRRFDVPRTGRGGRVQRRPGLHSAAKPSRGRRDVWQRRSCARCSPARERTGSIYEAPLRSVRLLLPWRVRHLSQIPRSTLETGTRARNIFALHRAGTRHSPSPCRLRCIIRRSKQLPQSSSWIRGSCSTTRLLRLQCRRTNTRPRPCPCAPQRPTAPESGR